MTEYVDRAHAAEPPYLAPTPAVISTVSCQIRIEEKASGFHALLIISTDPTGHASMGRSVPEIFKSRSDAWDGAVAEARLRLTPIFNRLEGRRADGR
jgi:hypothetical protein